MVHYSPTKAEVLEAATSAISIFAIHGLSCYLVGGVACALYGNSRTPEDVDLVVNTLSYSQEALKRLLEDHPGSKFFTVAARTPGATYRVLRYTLSGSYSTYPSCKVDVLQPGIMNIPSVASARVLRINGFPVMPLIPLMLLKLQAWEDHRRATQAYQIQKQYTDAHDLARLLPIAVRRGDSMATASGMPEAFVREAQRRITTYLVHYPEQEKHWKAVGLEAKPGPAVKATPRTSSVARPQSGTAGAGPRRTAPERSAIRPLGTWLAGMRGSTMDATPTTTSLASDFDNLRL